MRSLVDFWSIFEVDDDICVRLLRIVSYVSIYFRHHSAWGMRLYDWHPWLSIQGLGLIHWQLWYPGRSWRWAAAVISQLLLYWRRCQPIENYNNTGNEFSCSTIVDIIYGYSSIFILEQNQIFSQRFILIDTDSSKSSTKTIQTIFGWCICC